MKMNLSISQAHANCVSVFLALIEASHSPSHKELLNETQDVFDRYKLWAGNVGAIHGTNKYKLSLDYRLREASFYKSQVLKLMQDLQSCVRNLSSVAVPFTFYSISNQGQQLIENAVLS
ncbi:hypothetical protein B0T12DRAFT_185745 [Alternaria alternata]|nr:hypothetical protein B0T12DRAFT_185745 [Alternaria alternata]